MVLVRKDCFCGGGLGVCLCAVAVVVVVVVLCAWWWLPSSGGGPGSPRLLKPAPTRRDLSTRLTTAAGTCRDGKRGKPASGVRRDVHMLRTAHT